MTKNEKNHTLVKAFALAALSVAAIKCLRLHAWQMAGCPEDEQWDKRRYRFSGPGGVLAAKRWRKIHGHIPPWGHEWPKPDNGESEAAESPADTAAAATA